MSERTIRETTVSIIEVIVYGYDDIRRITTWADAFSVVLYGNLYLALPLITSVASLPIICDELRTNNNYFHFSRMGVKKYIYSKYCSILIGGVAALLMGFLLFAAIVCVFFPSYYDFGQSQIVGLEEQNIFGMLWQVVKYSLNMICWGALLSIISCGLVSIAQNIYIVLCVPFLLNYVAAHVLFNLKIYMFIILAVIFYYMGYKLWIKKYRGVRA